MTPNYPRKMIWTINSLFILRVVLQEANKSVKVAPENSRFPILLNLIILWNQNPKKKGKRIVM